MTKRKVTEQKENLFDAMGFEDHFVNADLSGIITIPIIHDAPSPKLETMAGTVDTSWRDDEDRREAKELRFKCLELSLKAYDDTDEVGTAAIIRRGAAFYNYVTRND